MAERIDRRLASPDHFTIDGTHIRSLAGHKSLTPTTPTTPTIPVDAAAKREMKKDVALHRPLGQATPIHPWNEEYGCELFYQRLVNDNTVDEATLEANSQDWMLLLQVDSIPPDWTWGANGLLYIYIRRQDLAARDFSKVCVEMECY